MGKIIQERISRLFKNTRETNVPRSIVDLATTLIREATSSFDDDATDIFPSKVERVREVQQKIGVSNTMKGFLIKEWSLTMGDTKVENPETKTETILRTI